MFDITGIRRAYGDHVLADQYAEGTPAVVAGSRPIEAQRHYLLAKLLRLPIPVVDHHVPAMLLQELHVGLRHAVQVIHPIVDLGLDVG